MKTEYPPEVLQLYERLDREAKEGGYILNPERDFVLALVESLAVNTKRYGYPTCPCRLAFGEKSKDLDIICPCDYRDADLEEYGACYCALYVTEDWIAGKKPHKSIPERRPAEFMVSGYSAKPKNETPVDSGLPRSLSYPVWRCKVCGYLCARNEPPGVCPVCKAKKERFERFL